MSDYRTYTFNKRENIAICAASFGLCFVIGWLYYDTLALVLATPIVVIALRKPVRRILLEARIKKIRDQFRDVLYSFSSAFATGAHMEEAMESAYLQLLEVYGESGDMAKELDYMIRRIRDSAESDVELWNSLAERTHIDDIRDFAGVFAACRDAGGNLVEAVDRAAGIIVEKINTENDMRTTFYQKKFEGYMIGAMPIAMVLLLKLSSSGYLDVMYNTLIGRGMMTIALAGVAVGFWLTWRITNIKV